MKRWIPFISHNGPKEINDRKRSFHEEDPSEPIVYLFRDKIKEDEIGKKVKSTLEDIFKNKREREREELLLNMQKDCNIFIDNIRFLCKNINNYLKKEVFNVESERSLESLCNVITYNEKIEHGFKIKIELSEDLSQKFIYIIFYYRKFNRKFNFRKKIWDRYLHSRSNIKIVEEIYVNFDQITNRDLEEWLKWIYHEFKRSYTPDAVKRS